MAPNGDHFLAVAVPCGLHQTTHNGVRSHPVYCVLVTGEFYEMLDSKQKMYVLHACVFALWSLRICKSQGQCSLQTLLQCLRCYTENKKVT